MSEAVLSLSCVSKVFGQGEAAVRALSGIDLEVGRGKLVVVTGPSGSGKTTLLQIAGALMSPSSGEVIVEGTTLSELSPGGLARLRAERIGFVFQSFNLFANLDARGNIHLPTALLPRSRRRSAKDPDALLRNLGVDRRARHLPGELSGGQQQRVAIARALWIPGIQASRIRWTTSSHPLPWRSACRAAKRSPTKRGPAITWPSLRRSSTDGSRCDGRASEGPRVRRASDGSDIDGERSEPLVHFEVRAEALVRLSR